MNSRHYSPADKFLMHIDTGLRTVLGRPQTTERPNPAEDIEESELTDADKELAGRLMRINHAGEVAAQGLYEGQSLTARLPEVREKMERAAMEENDHLAWCESRINELGSHKSLLNPLWYGGSLAIGAIAGLAGDKWSLGFVVETERQVIQHLDGHLKEISPNDQKSRVILEKMREDEAHHATTALNAGAASFPPPIKSMMGLMSKVMTRVALYI